MAQEADGVRLPTLVSKPFAALPRVHLRVPTRIPLRLPTRKQLAAITADTRFVLLIGLLLQTRTAR